ncbi:MAG: hypothetical protein DWQ01_03655 [Planctomycetota bacterium]|nr:MAG: hypothetical protein DWQ01_03655 [Planctomycetota bacterium]
MSFEILSSYPQNLYQERIIERRFAPVTRWKEAITLSLRRRLPIFVGFNLMPYRRARGFKSLPLHQFIFMFLH